MAFRPHGLLVVVIFMAQAANAAQGKHKESLSDKVNRDMSLKEQMTLTLSLSMPSIMAQFSDLCGRLPCSDAHCYNTHTLAFYEAC